MQCQTGLPARAGTRSNKERWRRGQGRTIVTVVPVTHTSPADLKAAIEIPSALRVHLGLDAKRS
jgi:hypothetical protein